MTTLTPGSPMISRAIAEKLSPEGWQTVSKSDAYRSPQIRFTVAVEQHSGLDILQYVDELRDPVADAEQFAEDLLGGIADQLSMADMEALIRALSKRYIAWGKGASRESAMARVYDLFEGLLDNATRR